MQQVLLGFSNALRKIFWDGLGVFSLWKDRAGGVMPAEPRAGQADGDMGSSGGLGPPKQPVSFSSWQHEAPLSPSRCSLCL